MLVEIARALGDKVVLHLSNETDADAEVTAFGTSFGDGGRVQTERHVFSLPAKGSTEVEFRVAEAELATRVAVRGGRVQFSVDARFSDGRRDANITGHVFYTLDDTGVTFSQSYPFSVEHLTDLGRARGLDPGRVLEVALIDPEGARQPGATDRIHSRRLDPESNARELGTAQGFPVRSAANVTLCFNIVTTYLDTAEGREDYWSETYPTQRRAFGNKIDLDGTIYHLSWTPGSEGCIVTNKSGMTLPLKVFSVGNIENHTLRVEDNGGVVGVANKTITTPTSGSALYSIEIANQDTDELELNIYMAAARALSLHRGLGTGTLTIVENGSLTGASYFCRSTHATCPVANKVYLAGGGNEGPGETGDAREKFTIAHELGHHVVHDSGIVITTSSSGDEDCLGAHGQTGVGNKRYQSLALNEGIATMYAGAAFNIESGSTPDCWVNLGEGRIFSCKSNSSDLPVRVMEEKCPESFTGFANATDWTRALWRVHTNGSSSTDVTMNQILQWMEGADDGTSWSNTNAYTLMNAEADDIGGSLNSRFDTAKSTHGVDH